MAMVDEYYRSELLKLAAIRDLRHLEFLKALHEDTEIAERMRDVWACQNSGQEAFG